MATKAGPPSGRGIDVDYLLARIADQVQRVEEEWNATARISYDGRRRIADFAFSALSDLDRRGLPPGVDEDLLIRQIDALVPEFLNTIRLEAERSDLMIRAPNGSSEVPAALIDQHIAAFTAQRCLCWPQ